MSIFKRKRRKAAVAKALQRAADQEAQKIHASYIGSHRLLGSSTNGSKTAIRLLTM